MVAVSAVSAAAVPYQPRYDWYSTWNDQLFAGFLEEGGLIDFPKLQRYLWNGTSPIRFGVGTSAFGKYFLYLLFSRCRPRCDGPRLSKEEIANLCNSLHYMAIWTIMKKFAYTSLVPRVIYNLTQSDCGRLPSDGVVERNFTFGTLTVPVRIRTSFLQALFPNFSVATGGHPRGCVLVLAYQYGDEFGVYHYGHRNSTCVQSWECHTEVNPLETAFSAQHEAVQVASELITEDAFHEL